MIADNDPADLVEECGNLSSLIRAIAEVDNVLRMRVISYIFLCLKVRLDSVYLEQSTLVHWDWTRISQET